MVDIVEVEDGRTVDGEKPFKHLPPLRSYRGNYGVPRKDGDLVVKGFFKADETTIKRLKELHDVYVRELSRHVPTIQTTSRVADGLFTIEQAYVPGVTLEQLLVDQETGLGEKGIAYQTTLDQALSFLKNSDLVVGIDGKPENWIRSDATNQWLYLDTFPPFLIEDTGAFRDIFYLRSFELNFTNNPDRSFFREKKKVTRRLWLKSEKFEPLLDYKALSLEVLSAYDHQATEALRRYQ